MFLRQLGLHAQAQALAVAVNQPLLRRRRATGAAFANQLAQLLPIRDRHMAHSQNPVAFLQAGFFSRAAWQHAAYQRLAQGRGDADFAKHLRVRLAARQLRQGQQHVLFSAIAVDLQRHVHAIHRALRQQPAHGFKRSHLLRAAASQGDAPHLIARLQAGLLRQ